MKIFIPVAVVVALLSAASATANPQTQKFNAPSAQVETPASPAKLGLIRRYVQVIGRQHQFDTGSFLERYALSGGPMWQESPGVAIQGSLGGGFETRMTALKNAYAAHRAAYQEAYESHVNREFTEAEIQEILAFLERPVGRHFLDGRWRMDAYVGTNTEELEEEIAKEAIASLNNQVGVRFHRGRTSSEGRHRPPQTLSSLGQVD